MQSLSFKMITNFGNVASYHRAQPLLREPFLILKDPYSIASLQFVKIEQLMNPKLSVSCHTEIHNKLEKELIIWKQHQERHRFMKESGRELEETL